MRALNLFCILLFLGCFTTHGVGAERWISSSGTGPACTRAAPCSSVFAALNVAGAAAGDTIHCVDAANYGNVTVFGNLPYSLICPDVGAAMQFIGFSYSAASPSFVVEIEAAATMPSPSANLER